MDDKQFDRLINDALKNFEANHVPSNWDQFESQLNKELDQDWNKFDTAIHDKVKDYQVPYQSNYWYAFEAKLEHSLHTDYANELDANVKSMIGNYQVAYDESTWPILEKKIEERKAYIRKLILTKSIEAAIVIFAIFTFYTYFPFFHQQFKNWKDNNQGPVAVQEYQYSDKDQTDSKYTSKELVAPMTNPEFAQHSNNNAEIEQNKSENKRALAYPDPSFTNRSASTPIENENIRQEIAVLANDDRINENLSSTQQRKLLSSSTLQPSNIEVLSEVEQEVLNLTYEVTDSKRELIAEVQKSLQKKPKFDRKELIKPLEPGKDIAFASLNDQVRSVVFNSFDVNNKKKIWSLGIYGSADLNYINIPQDEYVDYKQRTFEFREKDLVEMGFGTGLSVNLRMGALSFETGINYNYKRYDPNKNYSPAEGFSQINYKRINMNIVEIPLNVQYRWDNEGRLKVYGVAGAAINAIAISDHDLVIPQPTLRGHTRSSSENFEVLRVKSHFLKGDDDRETYYTLNLGVGVEYYLSEYYTIFAEPIYKQQFLTGGIGPNRDRINTASLKIGSRMSF